MCYENNFFAFLCLYRNIFIRGVCEEKLKIIGEFLGVHELLGDIFRFFDFLGMKIFKGRKLIF